MTTIDWVILTAYLLGVLGVGGVLSRRQHRPGEYLLAGRSMHWLPIGLSVMATAFSATNYVAFSGEVFANGLYVALSLPMFVLVAPVITRVFMPFYHRMDLTSAYAYLEHRFSRPVRQLASGLFVLWRIAWLAVTLHALCMVLAKVTGASFLALVLGTGLAAALYTLAGGMRAVMWTDVLQFAVLLVGIVAGVWLVAGGLPGGFGGLLGHAHDAGLMKPFHPYDPKLLAIDPTVRIALPSALIGTFVAFLTRYGADQVVVQRYFTARSLGDLRRGFHLNYAAAIVTLVALALLGFAIHARAASAGVLGSLGPRPIAYVAWFLKQLPPGLTGLILAGLFAAAMSSVDSGVHSCASAVLSDFARPVDEASPAAVDRRLRAARLWTGVMGVLATLAATQVYRLGSVFAMANRVINGLGSPLLAVMLLGMFSRRANAPGMLVGGILGVVFSVGVCIGIPFLALHYYAVVNLLGTAALCYGGSLAATAMGYRQDPSRTRWTWQAVCRTERGE